MGFALEEVQIVRDNAGLVFPPVSSDRSERNGESNEAEEEQSEGGGLSRVAVLGVGRYASSRLTGRLAQEVRWVTIISVQTRPL